MILYHFVNKEFGLKDIREKRLKLAEISTLNDPFEFISVAAPTKAARRLIREWRASMAKDAGLLCFSRNWHNPVQWAHYADRHKGLCLGFEVDQKMARQVQYVQSRPTWPEAAQWTSQESRRIVDQLLYTKFAHWSYEDEYRMFTTKNAPDIDGLFYVKFSEQLKLRSVLVGACSTLTRSKLHEALGDQAGEVETFKVRLAFRDFKVVRQRKESEWR